MYFLASVLVCSELDMNILGVFRVLMRIANWSVYNVVISLSLCIKENLTGIRKTREREEGRERVPDKRKKLIRIEIRRENPYVEP